MLDLMNVHEAADALGITARWVPSYAKLPDGDPRQLLPVTVAKGTRKGKGVKLYLRRDVARVAAYRAANPEKRGRPRKQTDADLTDCA